MFKKSREWHNIRPDEREIVARHMKNVPVKLGAMAKELGISVKLSSLPINVSGQISKTSGGYEIKINRHESRQRQRFTLAHEISHYLLHRTVIDDLGGTLKDNVLYRSGAEESIEYEANRLAAHIVMPEDVLEKAYLEYGEQLSEAAIEHLAEQFGVSKAAMEIRVAA
ncbi:ImmA/IrrE family metallo-endopeptidase [Nitratireductor sp. L1-7-SE]|uniref:ImmA/IrrE family metallo-endopeptidase n=1 Tax=Nitratireductor rhodophyticola TaxID=2854036 RepID=A0ABS7R311_9HYPH|nr:ImmA/IrrE family metallo-endopeptidase [Nitratireductor rhodophyticola]MBY8915315.1 ImmA/IrrE family metallo-endopeptidase [Nitratireductor rhodophyticola]MBY8919616.1 ImmA/IrrE family metallo-endopeptidase [Nitratireductor rhodophyticola]